MVTTKEKFRPNQNGIAYKTDSYVLSRARLQLLSLAKYSIPIEVKRIIQYIFYVQVKSNQIHLK